MSRPGAIAALVSGLSVAAALAASAGATPSAPMPSMLGGRPDFDIRDIPPGRFRAQIEALDPDSRRRAAEWIRGFSFPRTDTVHLHVDRRGGVFYADLFPVGDQQAEADPGTADPSPQGSIAVSPFPASLKFHSRPGAPNTIFLDFDGHMVSGTEWNLQIGRAVIPAVAFSADGDFSTFSDTEQTAIRRIWQRVSEDYAPFDVDVTTEAPAVFGSRTAHALITRSTDANDQPNPSADAGGVAYVGVFGASYYAQYRPAWIYADNLSYSETYMGEATSHELGHNMGLSHDGTTTGTTYYQGHGSGATSWAPIMGFSYMKSVTQWSKGEYYLANNTQDDLAILAGRLSYREDDRGGTLADATFLHVTGTNIVSTTPETDPANTNAANKGTLRTAADKDLWILGTGAGPVRIDVNPWISPSGTRGGNLDVTLRLLDATGAVVAASDPAEVIWASIQTNLPAGLYYLEVRGTGTGIPMANPPTGYTAYGAIGQYFISGWLQPTEGVVIPPTAILDASDIVQTAEAAHPFTVTYADDRGVDVSTLDGGDILITGPNSYRNMASFVSVDSMADGTPRTATYAAIPPGATWQDSDNGVYDMWIVTQQVSDVDGYTVAPRRLGSFTCRTPAVLYVTDMGSNPGWTLDTGWAFGTPAGAGGDPTSGVDGPNVIGFNLGGTYAKNLALGYATTPAFDCSQATLVTLTFWRWLGVASGDTAAIDVGVAGAWTRVWTAGGAVNDGAWTLQEVDITDVAAQTGDVRIRWAMGSNNDNVRACGWNIDGVAVRASASVADAHPPDAALDAQALTLKDQPVYAFTVTYSDDTAVALGSIDSADVLVTGPGGYSNLASLAGADSVTDTTPLTATYRLQGPGGKWDTAENGSYRVKVLAGAVRDTAGNGIAAADLGHFTVSIATQTWTLVTGVNNPDWGSISPAGGVYDTGTTVSLTATPAPYYRFDGWSGDLTGITNPAALVMSGNRTVYAAFSEAYTTNHPTPHWWLAQNGFTNNFEQATEYAGANGYALWESYVAGLDPTRPDSVVRITRFVPNWRLGQVELGWEPVTGRVYSVYYSPGLPPSFEPVPGGSDIPSTQPGYSGLLFVNGGFWQVRVKLAP